MGEDADYVKILEVGFSFWKAQALMAGVRLGLFSELAAGGALTAAQLRSRLAVHGRGLPDLLDALVALQLLEKTGDLYATAPDARRYLDPSQPTYVGELLEFAAARLYPLWASLAEALVTGWPQNEAGREGDYYANLCADRERHAKFLRAMDGISLRAAENIAERFPWKEYRTFVDVGGGRGALAVRVATRHPHLTGGSFDLPAVGPHFDDYVRDSGLAGRLRFTAGDFFLDPLPRADVLLMGHVLHNWSPEQKRLLLRKAYDALPRGGRLIVYEWFVGEGRTADLLGRLMSLNMLLSTRGGGASSAAECRERMREAGFVESRAELLVGPCSMVVGVKGG